ncbi:MAG TPA: site-2 protease family protein [Bryobacteraceae bacterium]
MVCPGCTVEIDESALSCPQCRRLTHVNELEDLAGKAHAAWRIGDFAAERRLWEESLKLLPPDTVQYRSIENRLAELEQQFAAAAPAHGGGWKKVSAGVGPALLLLLTKGKVLLLGLTKLGTLLTMFAAFGVYWTMFGWAFAAGLVLSIYIHEMGHVVALRGYGFPATAPMFIPGLGAFIRLRGVKVPPIPDNRIGLAGPLYGLGAAAAAMALFAATRAHIWSALAHFGAVVNLFNLIPVWQLDGSRAFHSLTRRQRGLILVLAVVLWIFTSNPMLFLIAAVAAWRMFTRDWQSEPDSGGMIRFAAIMAALALVGALSPVEHVVPTTATR